ncbi:MAG: hypothetical protein HGJ94_20815 [Desulfosarcina sp.]|nr:hypothetical protein [Desulfosarcina sp.]MBC2741956.1 hypothetical protein [Desulfosarcina sp.]MBC2764869.1 hypothetical protein [Desulfosarcina sp.]
MNYFSGVCQDLKAGGMGLIIFLLLDIFRIDGDVQVRVETCLSGGSILKSPSNGALSLEKK